MEINIIASGSTGNAYIIQDGKTSLLIECGIPYQRLIKGAKYRFHEIEGCLLTHEHKDHSKAVFDVVNAGIECYCTKGTADAVMLTDYNRIKAENIFKIGSFLISPFTIKHDATEPVGFVIRSLKTNEKLMFLTDSGDVTHFEKKLDYLMIECNYAEVLLQRHLEAGTLPERLRNRIEGSHMEIESLKKALKKIDKSKLKKIFLLHLSSPHSDRDMFIEEIQKETGIPTYV